MISQLKEEFVSEFRKSDNVSEKEQAMITLQEMAVFNS